MLQECAMVSGYEFYFKLLKLKELIILIMNHCVHINFMHIDKLVYIYNFNHFKEYSSELCGHCHDFLQNAMLFKHQI